MGEEKHEKAGVTLPWVYLSKNYVTFTNIALFLNFSLYDTIRSAGFLMFKIFICTLFLLFMSSSKGFAEKECGENQKDWKAKDESYWRSQLTPEQFEITRRAGTERPFSGKYDKHYENGSYICSNCGQELFSSAHKYDSGSGWPSFYDLASAGVVELRSDNSHGMVRVEVLCSRCDAHLGHLFDDGPDLTGKGYCINSASLNFKKN